MVQIESYPKAHETIIASTRQMTSTRPWPNVAALAEVARPNLQLEEFFASHLVLLEHLKRYFLISWSYILSKTISNPASGDMKGGVPAISVPRPSGDSLRGGS